MARLRGERDKVTIESRVLYFSEMIDGEDLIRTVSRFAELRGLRLELERLTADRHLTERSRRMGFPLGVLMRWEHPYLDNHSTHIELAHILARRYRIAVATELPDRHPENWNPYHWCVVKPDGTTTEAEEYLGSEHREDQIVIDMESQIPLTYQDVISSAS